MNRPTRLNLIRPATLADLPALIDLDRACSAAAHWTEQQYRQAFQPQPGDAPRLAIVAEVAPLPTVDAKLKTHVGISGFLVARQLAPEWELENIVVAPAARRTGLGTRLLKTLFASARETNGEAVFLEVRESNAAARSLYERAGFELTGRRKAYYTSPPEDAVLYRLRLA